MHPDPVDLARELVAIDSVNPSLVPGAAGEGEIVDFCSTWLTERGLEVERVEPTPGRPSLIATVRGTGGGRALLLNAHLDTVAASATLLEPRIHAGMVTGRGSYDTKGGAAALMVSAARLVGAHLRGDLVLTLVADEEFGSIGTENVFERMRAGSMVVDGAIIAEPSELELTLAHRGFAWFRVDIAGVAAHGSMPEQGVDAIAHAARVMGALGELQKTFDSAAPHPLLKPGTVRVATIEGGKDAATVAPACSLTIERRFLPHESPDAVEAELRAVIDAVPGEATVTLTRLVARGAFEAPDDAPIVAAVRAAAQQVLGTVVVRGEPFWTDAGLIAEAGIPCVVMGVAGGGAHADEEYATTESIERLADIVERAARDFCA